MAYIGKVKVSDTWTKLEDLIKEQIDGQSSRFFKQFDVSITSGRC